ncbi:hypothetical protein ATER59S_05747 [Aquamicrobium terrae]
MTEKAREDNRKHLWIPTSFVLFFICLAGLEIWFVTIANSSFTGVVTDDAYAIGLNYNEVLKRREAERRLGWTTAIAFTQGTDLAGEVRLTVRNADGQSLAADDVRATAERMSRFPQIQAVEFERQSDGQYLAKLNVPLAGRWFLRVRIEKGGEAIHVIEEVDVRP